MGLAQAESDNALLSAELESMKTLAEPDISAESVDKSESLSSSQRNAITTAAPSPSPTTSSAAVAEPAAESVDAPVSADSYSTANVVIVVDDIQKPSSSTEKPTATLVNSEERPEEPVKVQVQESLPKATTEASSSSVQVPAPSVEEPAPTSDDVHEKVKDLRRALAARKTQEIREERAAEQELARQQAAERERQEKEKVERERQEKKKLEREREEKEKVERE